MVSPRSPASSRPPDSRNTPRPELAPVRISRARPRAGSGESQSSAVGVGRRCAKRTHRDVPEWGIRRQWHILQNKATAGAGAQHGATRRNTAQQNSDSPARNEANWRAGNRAPDDPKRTHGLGGMCRRRAPGTDSDVPECARMCRTSTTAHFAKQTHRGPVAQAPPAFRRARRGGALTAGAARVGSAMVRFRGRRRSTARARRQAIAGSMPISLRAPGSALRMSSRSFWMRA